VGENPVDYEGYKLIDSVAGDKQFSLEGVKQLVPKEDTHYPYGEDKVVVLEDPRWDLGHLDKVVQKIVWKKQDLILLLMGYGMISPKGRVD